jgi:dTDP-4-dehydrorhamnose reductase
MRTLILGGTGTIGSAVADACDDRRLPHLRTGYRGTNPDTTPLDVRDADAVRELIADYQPEATVYAAPADERGVANVAAAVRDAGGVLVAFSGAGVFGECRQLMREDDPLDPVGETAGRLAAAEQVVREILPERSLILRTCGVFGSAPFGPVSRLVNRMRRGDRVRADHGRTTLPTLASDLAEVTLDLLKHGHTGTFHAVGPERHTDFTFARLVAHLFGHDADLVVPTDDADDDRPRRVLLDRLRLRTLFGPNAFRGPADGLRAVRQQMAGRRLAVAA